MRKKGRRRRKSYAISQGDLKYIIFIFNINESIAMYERFWFGC